MAAVGSNLCERRSMRETEKLLFRENKEGFRFNLVICIRTRFTTLELIFCVNASNYLH